MAKNIKNNPLAGGNDPFAWIPDYSEKKEEPIPAATTRVEEHTKAATADTVTAEIKTPETAQIPAEKLPKQNTPRKNREKSVREDKQTAHLEGFYLRSDIQKQLIMLKAELEYRNGEKISKSLLVNQALDQLFDFYKKKGFLSVQS